MEEFNSPERLRHEKEDRADAAAFKRAKRRFEKNGRPGTPLEQVKKRLGL